MPEAPTTSLPAGRHFVIGGGVMGEAIRAKDWSQTPLGPIENWPQSLRTAVSLCLASNFPINLIWGPEHIQIYNDGYRPVCAGKHPKSLGEDYSKTWASAWDILSSSFERALAGETSFLENQRMFLDRNGYLEETFFTFSLSPIRDESGEVGGLFHPVTETTAQMLSERRTRALRDLSSQAGQAKTMEQACQLAVSALAKHQLDLPFVLVYLLDADGKRGRLTAGAYLTPETKACPVVLAIGEDAVWPCQEVVRLGVVRTVNNLEERFGPLPCGPYPESPQTAVLLPISVAGLDHAAGILIAGVSPRVPFTDEYRAFIDLVGASLTAALVNARAYEVQRKRAEELAELDRSKTVFFSNVSHEFRTPLTLMLGPLEEMLANEGQELSVKRDTIGLVHRNSLRLLRLVNTLLEFSRIEANRVQASYEPTDLATLTRDLASNFRAVIEKAGLTLEVQCTRSSEPSYVDREMWEKIVLNLLSNAFKFTFDGTIQVRLEELRNSVRLSISDTGEGIPEQELPRLFERFHRVQGAQGRSYEGTGIGLALVEHLVKLHGGQVSVESQLGKGTTFRVDIPKGYEHLPPDRIFQAPRSEVRRGGGANMLVDEAAQWLPSVDVEPAVHGSAGSGSAPRRRIVLADDNADMRRYIQSILSPEYEIEAVEDGVKALEAIRLRVPDLVLTDVMMPGLDGFGLLKALRSTGGTLAIPVIMLSARAGEEARTEGIEAGADDYLVKPFNARELTARVRVNLELAHLRQKLSSEEEKRRSAIDIERQWRLFDTALSHTPDAIYLFDPDCRLIYANRALLERWGIAFDQAEGKTPAELGYDGGTAGKLQAQMQQVMRERVAIRDEASIPGANGEMRCYEYMLVPVLTKDSVVEGVAGSTRDVTEFRQNYAAVERANADLRQLAYAASHDMQEPLRMVAVYGQLLKKKYEGRLDDQADMIIHQCVEGARRMEVMISDLVAYTRSLEEPVALTSAVSLEEVFDKTLDDLRVKIAETNATITRGTLPGLKVEEAHIGQVFRNLIGNAIQYRAAERLPVIRVTAQLVSGFWIFAVSDNGIGIDDEYKEQVFGLFKRLHTRRKYAGTGLGLSVSKKLVERYGGRMWVESRVGEGSTFYFSLPAE